MDTTPLDWPTRQCAHRALNEQALELIKENRAAKLTTLIVKEGLTELCCGDHSHALLHAAAKCDAWNCIRNLLLEGWSIDRRMRTRYKDKFKISDPTAIAKVPPLKVYVTPSKFAPGEVDAAVPYDEGLGPTPLETALMLYKLNSARLLLQAGADPDAQVLGRFVRSVLRYGVFGDEVKELSRFTITKCTLVDEALRRGIAGAGLARDLIRSGVEKGPGPAGPNLGLTGGGEKTAISRVNGGASSRKRRRSPPASNSNNDDVEVGGSLGASHDQDDGVPKCYMCHTRCPTCDATFAALRHAAYVPASMNLGTIVTTAKTKTRTSVKHSNKRSKV